MDLTVKEQRLAGIGMRYELQLENGRTMFVVAEGTGRRTLGLMEDPDTPGPSIVLDAQQAVMVAALLLGARFTVETGQGEMPGHDVMVDTFVLSADSPVIGRTKAQIHLDDPDATLLAVISDATPDVVEDEVRYRCRAGDRVVVAGRGSQMSSVVAHLGARPMDASAR
jgi:TrkA domain protein